MGETLDCFAKVYNSLNHIGQKKPFSILTSSVKQAFVICYLTSAIYRTVAPNNPCIRGGSSSVFFRGVPGESSGKDARPLGGSGAFLPENFEN